MQTTSSTRPIARRARRRMAGWCAMAMLATVLPSAGRSAAIDPLPDDAPGRGEEITVDYWSEPEYLLTDGTDTWNVRNTPDGTVAAAYGQPDGPTLADRYMVSGRYEPSPPTSDARILDVSVLRATTLRARTWAFVRFDDGTAEVRGPLEDGLPARHPLSVPDGPIVGGTVVVDEQMSDSTWRPVAHVVLDDGSMHQVSSDGTTSRLPDLAELGSPVAAVARMFTTFASADQNFVAEQFGESTDILAVLDASPPGGGPARVLPLRPVVDGTLSWQAMPGLALELDADESVGLVGSTPPLLDADVICAIDRQYDAAGGDDRGPVAEALGCPELHGGVERPSIGRFAAAVDTGTGSIRLHHSFDTQYVTSGGVATVYDYGSENTCRTDGSATPGAFDVRTTAGQSFLACASAGVSGSTLDAEVVVAPTAPFARGDGSGGAPLLTDERRYSGSSFVSRRVVDDLAAEQATTTLTGIRELRSPTVQLAFPCESLLPRPTASGRQFVECGRDQSYEIADDAKVPNEQLDGKGVKEKAPRRGPALVMAGFGVEDDAVEYTPFVTHVEVGAEGAPDQWTIVPERYLGDDIATMRTTPSGSFDRADFDRYEVGDEPPPLFLTSLPRPSRTPVTIRITSDPRIETVPGLPIAILQAPPTVGGLGQQTAASPEFASSKGSSSGVGKSRSSRMGAHAGFEVVATVGVKLPGIDGSLGGGVAFEYGFTNEVTRELNKSVTFETTESYGGSFADHTVVTTSRSNYVFDAVITADPTGVAAGDTFEYRIPAGMVNQSRLLSDLEREAPGLYGADGLYRPTVDRVIGDVVIGDPGSYESGAGEPQPAGVLSTNGGPCQGGYAAPDEPTPYQREISLPPLANPYLSSDPEAPVGPSVILSAPHIVDVGNDLTEGASIVVTNETTESEVTSASHDMSLEAIVQVETEVGVGGSFGLEMEARAGIHGGWSNGATVSDSLAVGTELSTVMGNIPISPDGRAWLDAETYEWQMYFCKAALGPEVMGGEVWVQGYLVDGYAGTGGIDTVGSVTVIEPARGEVVAAAPSRTLTPALDVPPPTCGADGFEWDLPQAMVSSYVVEIENARTGARESVTVDEYDDPVVAGGVVVRDCATLAPDSFVEGELHRWRIRTDGFVDDTATSDWAFFRPQVVPSEHTIAVDDPIVLDNGSILLDIVDPTDVQSFRHDVVVYDAADVSPTGVVDTIDDAGTFVRTAALDPGDYVIEVVAHNDHVDASGEPITTPPVRVAVTVDDELSAQFRTTGCAVDGACTIADDIRFVDYSTPLGDVPIVNWYWTFGDGETSTEQSPVHRYDEPGTYDVGLYVIDGLGRTARTTARQDVGLPSASLDVAVDGGGEITLDGTTEFVVTVSNDGPDPVVPTATRPVTVDVDVPPGLDVTAANGDGWSCTVEPAVVCELSERIEPGAEAPPIVVVVVVTADGDGTDAVAATVSSSAVDDPIVEDDTAAVTYEITFVRYATLPTEDGTGAVELTSTGDELCVAISMAGSAGTITGVVISDGSTSVTLPVASVDRTADGAITCGVVVEVLRDRLANDPESVEVAVQLDGSGEPVIVASASATPPAAPDIGSGPTPGAAAVPDDATRFVPLAPTRLFDTRSGAGLSTPGAVPSGGTLDVQVAGHRGVPDGAVAVAINLTVDEPSGPGYITAYPTGSSRPLASTLNTSAAGQIRPSTAIVPLGTEGAMSIYAHAATHVLGDVVGYFESVDTAVAAGRIVPLDPARVFDTRPDEPGDGPKGFVGADASITVPVAGVGGVPSTGVSAVVLNVTATDAAARGFVTVWPSGSDRPLASSVNVDAGGTASNMVLVPLGAGGAIEIYTQSGAHLLADVTGWVTDDGAEVDTTGLFVPLDPGRVFDTRPGQPGNGPKGRVSPGGVIVPQFAGVAGIPSDAGSVVMNLTADDAATGFVTAWPAGTTRPLASTLNLTGPGDIRANSAILPLGSDGRISVLSQSGTHLLADTTGYFLR